MFCSCPTVWMCGISVVCFIHLDGARVEILYLLVADMEIARAYTVVPPSLRKDHWDTRLDKGTIFYLLVKIYTDGALTPLIGNLKIGKNYMARIFHIWIGFVDG